MVDLAESGVSKKLLFAIFLVVIAVVLALGFWWASQPSWAQLLKPETPEETFNEVRQQLMQWEIPYQEDATTNSIQIQSKDMLDVRSKLSKLGYPAESAPGLELFSESEYGMSEFTQRINFQRAIEAELARTIRSFPSISRARVHLSLPKESLFKDRTTQPKASVTVAVIENAYLSLDQTSGIRELVASSVDRLQAKNVVVLNEDGAVYQSSGTQEAVNHLNKGNLEKSYSEKAYGLVYEMVKTKEIQVAVNVQYNYDKVKSTKEEIFPNEKGQTGYLLKSSEQKTIAPSTEVKNRATMTDSMIEKEYVYTRERSEIEYSAGKIQRISVGIVITKDLSEYLTQAIVDLVTAGLGLETGRGDRVVVASAPASEFIASDKDFEYTASVSDEQDLQAGLSQSILVTGQNRPYLELILAALVLCLLGVILYLSLKTRSPARLSPLEREEHLKNLRSWLGEQN